MADKPDFSKIWASNSPLTPYTFTDANYLDGWNFIGSVPPSRGMFDAWMNGTDTKQKYLVDTLESLDAKSYTVDDTQVPSSNDGEAGALFSELAHMIKTASGTSDWKTNPATSLASLATSLGYFASGDDVVWSSKKFTNTKLGVTGLIDSNGYVCFGPNFGGLIIQWGWQDSSSRQFTYPVTFSERPVIMMHGWYVINVLNNGGGATYFTYRIYDIGSSTELSGQSGAGYIAIGH